MTICSFTSAHYIYGVCISNVFFEKKKKLFRGCNWIESLPLCALSVSARWLAAWLWVSAPRTHNRSSHWRTPTLTRIRIAHMHTWQSGAIRSPSTLSTVHRVDLFRSRRKVRHHISSRSGQNQMIHSVTHAATCSLVWNRNWDRINAYYPHSHRARVDWDVRVRAQTHKHQSNPILPVFSLQNWWLSRLTEFLFFFFFVITISTLPSVWYPSVQCRTKLCLCHSLNHFFHCIDNDWLRSWLARYTLHIYDERCRK